MHGILPPTLSWWKDRGWYPALTSKLLVIFSDKKSKIGSASLSLFNNLSFLYCFPTHLLLLNVCAIRQHPAEGSGTRGGKCWQSGASRPNNRTRTTYHTKKQYTEHCIRTNMHELFKQVTKSHAWETLRNPTNLYTQFCIIVYCMHESYNGHFQQSWLFAFRSYQ